MWVGFVRFGCLYVCPLRVYLRVCFRINLLICGCAHSFHYDMLSLPARGDGRARRQGRVGADQQPRADGYAAHPGGERCQNLQQLIVKGDKGEGERTSEPAEDQPRGGNHGWSYAGVLSVER